MSAGGGESGQVQRCHQFGDPRASGQVGAGRYVCGVWSCVAPTSKVLTTAQFQRNINVNKMEGCFEHPWIILELSHEAIVSQYRKQNKDKTRASTKMPSRPGSPRYAISPPGRSSDKQIKDASLGLRL